MSDSKELGKATSPADYERFIAKPGLEGIEICKTRLSTPDKAGGRLIYSGLDAAEVSTRMSFEQLWYYLRYGSIETGSHLDDFKRRINFDLPMKPEEIQLLKPATLRPGLATARTLVSLLGNARGLKPWVGRDLDLFKGEFLGLVASIPDIIAISESREPLRSEEGNIFSYVERVLYGLLGEKPSTEQVRILTTYMILVLDHGLNVSTFTARVETSTGTDAASILAAAIGSLIGPYHGGAPGPVLDYLVNEVKTAENAAAWVKAKLESDPKYKFMGFGHRIYKRTDPRARKLKEIAVALGGPLVDMALAVESHVLEHLASAHPGYDVTNVEFWTAVVLNSIGLRSDQFNMAFFSSRAVGWMLHSFEQLEGNKLYRPLAGYQGLPYSEASSQFQNDDLWISE